MKNSATNPPRAVPAVFKFENHEVRTVEKDGEAWFVLKDVCQVLTVNNVSDVAKRLDADEKDDIDYVDVTGRAQSMMVVNESGLYSTIMRSAKPEAKRFKKWVTSEVLPSIRKHGHYSVEPVSPALPTQPMELLFLAVDSIKQLNDRTLQIESRTSQVEDIALDTAAKFDDFLDTRPLLPHQCHAMQKEVSIKVKDLYNRHKVYERLLFSSIYGFTKRHFNVPTYSAIPARRFDEALLIVKGITIEQLPPAIAAQAKARQGSVSKRGAK